MILWKSANFPGMLSNAATSVHLKSYAKSGNKWPGVNSDDDKLEIEKLLRKEHAWTSF